MPEYPESGIGRVYLVGAGPGHPGLITLRGAECLRRADVVLYDYLVNPELLRHAPPDAEIVCLGRHGTDRIMPQAEVHSRMITHARAGRTVVRLKGGDPAVFARAVEEVEALQAAEVPFEIVPGVTAALAAGSYAGIHITDRLSASAVALVTGQEDDGKTASAIDYEHLAVFPGTLVFYMGVTTARKWTSALIEAGKSPDTPAAIIRRCSWPDQLTIHCALGSVADTIAQRKLRPPVLVILGEVVSRSETASWFTALPLFGRRIVVTRPAHQSEALAGRFRELGANVLYQPAIEIGDPADWQPVDEALAEMESFDWLVFSSSNGVHRLLQRLFATGGDLRRLGNTRLAAIGPGTADALAEYHLKADLLPDEFRAESLAAELAVGAAGRRFLLARASRGREVLADELLAAGGQVRQIVVYRSSDVKQPNAEVAAALEAGRIDWMTVTSSAIARSLHAMFGEQLRQTRLASISPVTSATLRELGLEPQSEATQYTMAGLVDAVLQGTQCGRLTP